MSHRFKSFVNFLTLCLFCITCSMPAIYADTLTIPNTFSAGTPAQASKINENFNAIPTVINGNLDNANIKSGAAIAPTKLDLTVSVSPTNEWFVKRAATNRCLSAGVTGDTVPRVTFNTDGSIAFGPGSASAVDVGVYRKTDSTIGGNPGIAAFLGASPGVFGSFIANSYVSKLISDTSARAVIGSVGSGGGGGIAFGDGTSTNTILRNASSTSVALRNFADSADADITLGAVTASGNVTCSTLVQGITPGGRLTLTSGTPVTGDVTGAGTLYYTPYVSNIYPAYSSSTGKHTAKTFTEASLTLSISSGTNYDIFGVYTSGSSPTLSAVAWTNDTTRATALVRSASTGGLLVKNGDAESLYLGTIRGSGVNVTAKSRAAGQLYVWNMYNRVMEDALAQDTTDSWTYTTAAFQEARAQSTEGTSRIGIVRGLDDDSLEAVNTTVCANTTVAVDMYSGIGIDSSTVNSAHGALGQQAVANQLQMQIASYKGRPGIGYRTFRRIERSAATGTTTWYGDGGGTIYQSGLRVSQPM